MGEARRNIPLDGSSVAAATEFLHRLPRDASPRAVKRSRVLLALLDSPQHTTPAVHVAGTAGKGSISAFIAAVLAAHGLRVGAHVSPHVRSIRERFQINGAAISEPELLTAAATVADAVHAAARTGAYGTPTFFEATYALAVVWFAQAQLDYIVIETGVGGLVDATNTIDRTDKLAVIGQIGLDHTHLLGSTVADIATHKAGILPVGGCGIVLNHDDPAVDGVVEATARDRRCHLELVDPRTVSCTVDPDGTVAHIEGGAYRLGLHGPHQGINAALALRSVQWLARRDGWTLTQAAVRTGLAQASLPGRFERHTIEGRQVILDGAHNGVKVAALADTLRMTYPGQGIVFVLAAKADKDLRSLLSEIASLARAVVATELPAHATPAAMSAADIAAAATGHGLEAFAEEDPVAAVHFALTLTSTGPVVVTGSFMHLSCLDEVLDGRGPRHTVPATGDPG